ncbi:MAG: hypothetical protein ACOY3D_05125 [Candidatus Omnitrophota bacterium]
MKIIKLAVIITLTGALILAAITPHYKLILEKIFSQALAAKAEFYTRSPRDWERYSLSYGKATAYWHQWLELSALERRILS